MFLGGWKDSSVFAEKNHDEQNDSYHVGKDSSVSVEKSRDEQKNLYHVGRDSWFSVPKIELCREGQRSFRELQGQSLPKIVRSCEKIEPSTEEHMPPRE